MNFDESQDHWISLIYDSLTDNINLEDKEKLNAWISLSKDNQDLFLEIKELHTFLNINDNYSHYNHEVAYHHFSSKNKSLHRKITFLKNASIAAVLMLAFGLAINFYKHENNAELKTSTITVKKGSKTKTVLNDGTTIWLNSNSELIFDENFGQSDRRVKLKGEGYFDVAYNEKKPFVVETSSLNIQVLGTSFDVATDEENQEVRVILVSGSVELISEKGKRRIMRPKEMITYNILDENFNLSKDIPSYELAWKEAKYVFKDKKFEDITNELERIYDVKIVVKKSSLLNRKFTGDFIHGESIHEIIQTMSVVGKFKYHIKGHNIEIY